ncbi:hypothetical protein M3Y97_00182900 [Aphelenchoides bicaudatus]|nr:hypothetical protein M3Y97_00182900 [Aphelenchoides bicaudatus]
MSAQILDKIYKTAHVFGLSAVLCMFLWMRHDGKGFGLQAEHLEFSFHPLCMALAFGFLNGEALMSFRSLRAYPRYLVKLLHAVLHGAAVIIIVLGIKAVRDSEDYHLDKDGKLSPLPRSQSLHAWLGSTIGVIYTLQWLGSLMLFYFPLTPGHIRATALPYHRIGGIFAFGFSAVTIAYGVLSRKAWGLDIFEQWIVNAFVVSIIGYILCVFFVVLNPSWSTKIPLSKLTEQKKVR